MTVGKIIAKTTARRTTITANLYSRGVAENRSSIEGLSLFCAVVVFFFFFSFAVLTFFFGSSSDMVSAKEKSEDHVKGALTIDIDFVITEDVGLRLDALNGFPGPYCKPMLETIGVKGLANLVLKYDEENGERNATATCTLAVLETSVAFKYPLFVEKCVHVFEGAIAGKIVEPRGNVQHGKASWNACFEVASNDETDGATFGELSYEQQSRISHRKKAIENFLDSHLILGRLS